MSLYPKDDKARKSLPVFKMITGYFPKALREVTRVCVVNNVRYNPERKPADINWARGKSTDQLGALYRHITEHIVDGTVFEDVPPEVAAAIGAEGFDHVYVLAEAAWRALAALELCIEEQEDSRKPVREPNGGLWTTGGVSGEIKGSPYAWVPRVAPAGAGAVPSADLSPADPRNMV